MANKTLWQPIAVKTTLALGFPNFTDLYTKPLFIKVTSEDVMDKREILAMGCEQLPEAAELIIKDFVIPKE